MHQSAAKARRAKQSRRAGRGDGFGTWIDLALDPVVRSDRTKFSHMELLLRQRVSEAHKGDPAAIRMLVRAWLANKRAHDSHQTALRPADYRLETTVWNARNGDLALLILGIAEVDNATLAGLRPGEPGYESRIKNLRPTRIARWAVNLALNDRRACAPGKGEVKRLEPSLARVDELQTSEWREAKSRYLSELMRLRGPGATRFSPGVSGNRHGRPPKWDYDYPYDHGFLLEPVSVRFQGKERTMPRLEALLFQLLLKGMKGDRKIMRVLEPVLMKVHEERFNEPPDSGTIIRGEGEFPWQ